MLTLAPVAPFRSTAHVRPETQIIHRNQDGPYRR